MRKSYHNIELNHLFHLCEQPTSEHLKIPYNPSGPPIQDGPNDGILQVLLHTNVLNFPEIRWNMI